MIKFRSLNQNKEFLKVLKKKRINTKYFTVYFDKNSKNFKNGFNKYLNISFVMKKKIGNCTPYIMTSFHPAFLMRQPDQKKLAWIDLKLIREKMKQLNF